MSTESFEELLTGGHPNSLGNTESVAQSVLDDASRLEELYQCYFNQMKSSGYGRRGYQTGLQSSA